MYDLPPSLAEMRAAGYEPEDFEDDEFEVYPENWHAVELFLEMQTQWRVGMGGAAGLDYGVLLYPGGLMDLHQVPAGDRRQMFDDIKVIECAALAQMNKKHQAA